VETASAEVVIRIVDAGPGLLAAESERVFEPFYRAGARGSPRGSGLGLAIVRGFATANGGRVWLDTRPGEGCAFALAFPSATEPLAVSS
jgi:signal transduction histidine kinase